MLFEKLVLSQVVKKFSIVMELECSLLCSNRYISFVNQASAAYLMSVRFI